MCSSFDSIGSVCFVDTFSVAVQAVCFFASEKGLLMKIPIILPFRDSSAMVIAKSLMMVYQPAGLVSHTFSQHLAELFNFQMERYTVLHKLP